MKWLFVFTFLFASCWKTEKEAKNECFQSNIGEYKFDIDKSMSGLGTLGIYEDDTMRLRNFHIVFKSDSTFYTNMRVGFFTDTFGKWETGTCGFERPSIIYYTSPSIEQFGACGPGDSFINKLSPVTSSKYGAITLWFKRCSNK